MDQQLVKLVSNLKTVGAHHQTAETLNLELTIPGTTDVLQVRLLIAECNHCYTSNGADGQAALALNSSCVVG